MKLSAKSLAGPGYVILNTLRFMNIAAFLTVICASVVMVVKTVMVSQFYFFDGVSHIITTFVSTFLIISELNLFHAYFASHWPLFSASHGFVTLGLTMIIIGVNVLGNLNKPALSRTSLGLPFWRVVTGSGILLITFGFLNIIASYVFRNKSLNVTSRQVRAKGAVAVPGHAQDPKPTPKSTNTSTGSTTRSSRRWPALGRRSTLPSYHTSPVPSSHYTERGSSESLRGLKISAPLQVNPQFAHLVRPDSAMHPSRMV